MESLAGAPLASFRKRALAFVIDFILTLVLLSSVAVPIAILGAKKGFLEKNPHLEFNFHEWYNLIALVLYFGLATYWGNGQTPGKRLCGIRVVSLVDRRITLWTAVERALGYGASVLELGSGFLQYFVEPNRRTVHDRIAETIVVEVRRSKWSEGGAAAERPLRPRGPGAGRPDLDGGAAPPSGMTSGSDEARR
jgi:uncharacterized RDD family membrane protein YckC